MHTKSKPKNSKVTIVTLRPRDWRQYKQLRLQGLETDPTAFGRLYEEEAKLSAHEWRKRLGGSIQGRADLFFAKCKNNLVGMVGIRYEKGKMFQHVAAIISFYVDPHYRGQGIGKKLMAMVMTKLKRHPKIIKVQLSVNAPQRTAIQLYKKMGFKQSGFSPYDGKQGDAYLDQIRMDLIFKHKL